jgi:cytoskeletal protein RodZ
MPIGQRLRIGREEKGASRVDVSQETKIAVHHLAALEYSDFKELPDMVHVKGYVRAYAEYLGLEPTAVLEEFLEEYQAQLPTEEADPRDEVVRKMSKMYGDSQVPWTRRLRPALAIAALALIALLVWVGWGQLGREEIDGAGEALGAPEVSPPQRYVVVRDPGEVRPAPVPEPVAVAEPVAPEREPVPEQQAAPEQEATPKQEATPTPAPTLETPVATTSRLRIQQYGVGTGVESRQLRGESDRFSLGTKVAFFTRVEGGRAGDTVRHVWRHEGAQIASIPLRVGGANWRTYSRKTMHAGSAGAWTVEAVDADGNVLARSRFDCAP